MCMCFVEVCARARACVCVLVCIGVVSVMTTTYRGCNCVYALCVSSFLRFLCFFNRRHSHGTYDFITRNCHLTIFVFDAGTIFDVYHRRALGMGVANEK